jgi:5-methylcytosine-specific restriction enzyme subunit McrC
MNHVFERFIGGFLRIRVMPSLPGYRLFSMSRKKVQHLMSCNGRGVLPLKPDLLIEAPDGKNRLVLDTKWKRLSNEGSRGGVTTNDLYQLFAYTRRYGCVRSLLLYPHVSDVQPRDFSIITKDNVHSGEQVGIRFIKLHRNLYLESEREKLAAELLELIKTSFGEIDSCNQPTGGRIA